MSRTTLVSTIAAAMMMLSLSTLRAADHPVAKIGQPAPGFTLQDQNGNPVKLSEFKGKIIVLEWTNPACPFVQRHYREHTMQNLYSRYKDQGVTWLAINSTRGDGRQVNKQWAERNHLPYPILDDSHGKVASEYQAKSTPDMFIINKDGALVYAGGIDNDPNGHNPNRVNYVQKALDEVLAGKPVAIPVTKSYGCGVHYED